MTARPGVSIVIANHNYATYLAEAIESALGQAGAFVEVIVVDDGSTDGSAAVIERYRGRITAVLQANAGQTRACEAGFRRSTQPIVIFLDADDRLVPEAAAMALDLQASAADPARVSKLQFRLQTMNAAGRVLDHIYPKYPADLAPGIVRGELLRTGFYACPPTSGNAYARPFLEAVSPFDEHPHIDALLNTLAPLYGDVLSSPEVIGHYRVHRSSNSFAGSGDVDRFIELIALDPLRLAILARHCERLGIPFAGLPALRHLLPYRELEVVIAKLRAERPRDHLAVLRLLAATLRAALEAPYTVWHRLLRACWITAVATTPRRWARRLVCLRYDPTRRPSTIEAIINAFQQDGRRPATPPRRSVAAVVDSRVVEPGRPEESRA